VSVHNLLKPSWWHIVSVYLLYIHLMNGTYSLFTSGDKVFILSVSLAGGRQCLFMISVSLAGVRQCLFMISVSIEGVRKCLFMMYVSLTRCS